MARWPVRIRPGDLTPQDRDLVPSTKIFWGWATLVWMRKREYL